MRKLPSMPEIVLRKIGRFILLFVGVVTIGFMIIHLAPGSPADTLVPMSQDVGAEAREKMIRLYDLDKPLPLRFAFWLRNAVLFDFGHSLIDGRDVTQKIVEAIPVTLGLNVIALMLGLGLAIPIGVWCAVRKGRIAERSVSIVLAALVSFPSFWLAFLLIGVFSIALGWTPVSGLHTIFYEKLSWPVAIADFLRHLALPIAVLSIPMIGALSKYVQSSVERELHAPYVRAARARGLSEGQVLFAHALRNALLPLVTILGLSVPGLLGGSVVLESIFSLPGMGRLFFQAVGMRDYPVIMGIFTIGSLLTLAGNAIADAAYAYVDPRIRREGEGA